jgi:Family of unknown function (DUF6496)
MDVRNRRQKGVFVMAKHETKAQKDTIERVMHEYKHGELRGRGSGPKVKNPKQAMAIALSEAGASRYDTPKENKEHLKRTKAKERRGETARDEAEGKSGGKGAKQGRGSEKTRSELYQEARRREIPGRSKMSKAALQRALSR